jgi:hypothetical protein
MAVREDEEAAEASGVHVLAHILLALTISSFFASLAGWWRDGAHYGAVGVAECRTQRQQREMTVSSRVARVSSI